MTSTPLRNISNLQWSSQELQQFFSYHCSVHPAGAVPPLLHPEEILPQFLQQLREQEGELCSSPKGAEIIQRYPLTSGSCVFYFQRQQALDSYNKLQFWFALPGGFEYLKSRVGQKSDEEIAATLEAWIQDKDEVIGLRTLRLSDRQITRIPPEIGLLTRLEVLEINKSPIRFLPPQIGALTRLRQFSLHHTLVKVLPREFQNLMKLEHIVLLNNQLENIDPLGPLSNLVRLSASTNKIKNFPSSLAWQKMQTLDLSNNQIEELPSSFYLSFALSSIILYNNRIRLISDRIADLTQLKTLCLNENCLSLIPSSLAKLPNLSSLNVTDNQLTCLPVELAQMSYLRELCIKNNRIAQRPPFLHPLTETDIDPAI
ncbi:MAG: hypothetical protein JSS10_04590 [Verrucomicrobia bacterium]|nr:hypothetical protein [Verrucomicrobiota bacterium]